MSDMSLSKAIESLTSAAHFLRQAAEQIDMLDPSAQSARDWFRAVNVLDLCAGKSHGVTDRVREGMLAWVDSDPAVALSPAEKSAGVTRDDVLQVIKTAMDEAFTAPTMHLAIVRTSLGTLRDDPKVQAA
ncbi:hypothetical protein ACIBCT_35110 [Streptosporangium sp. NPDC050855]|uniref:hypothetical protein n=1 Tax=Streptosporangium sp. NPDC050855 TaxID=3366194 RepID=UPI003799510A